MKGLTTAEKLLQSLGVTEPDEIDLEAIAWTLGVKVRFRPLDGCEARIIGRGDHAIVTVNSRSGLGRQRFSIAHELGHWEFHRGQIMVCRPDEAGDLSSKASPPEKRADRFAADLLMPSYLFRPTLKKFHRLDFDIIRKFGEMFGVSLTAAAIRMVGSDEHPAILICHNQHGRKWFLRSSLIPGHWFPRTELQPESSAMDILFGKRSHDPQLRCVYADAWFDRYNAHKFEIAEQTYRISADEILTLLIIEDDEMLE
jgi:hypothetical protein